ncbi:MAG: hypothetical protein KKC51_09025 [Verrucomicrobia bacterium]|nr:hypothetical protein [Verrucomicrobiota bacterium]
MKRRMLTVIFILLGVALIALIALFVSRGRAKPTARPEEESGAQVPALPARVGEKESFATPLVQRVEIMPLDERTLERFQEANSRAMSQLLEQQNGLPYTVAASVSLRAAMADLGHDPDKTLLYWLSPKFQKDRANGNQKEAVSLSRSTGNLLSIALGDNASDEEFAVILKQLSPEVRLAAIKRRGRE